MAFRVNVVPQADKLIRDLDKLKRVDFAIALRFALRPVVRRIRRSDFGFTDRTRNLRSSFIERYVRLGKRGVEAILGSNVFYAGYVEWKVRTNDESSRRGLPPYWINRAFYDFQGLVKRRYNQKLRELIKRKVRR